MFSRFTVPVWDMYHTSSLLGDQKSCSVARPPEVRRTPVPWTLILLHWFSSVHLSGWRQTTVLGRRWMEVVNGGETDRMGEREMRVRCMAAHIAPDRVTDEGIMEQGYFPQWSKFGSLPAQLRLSPGYWLWHRGSKSKEQEITSISM